MIFLCPKIEHMPKKKKKKKKKKTLEKHISKQMRVYKQITFFYKKSKFPKIFFPDRKIDFLRGEPIFGLKNPEPEPDPGGPQGDPGVPQGMFICPYVHPGTLGPQHSYCVYAPLL